MYLRTHILSEGAWISPGEYEVLAQRYWLKWTDLPDLQNYTEYNKTFMKTRQLINNSN